MPDQTLAQTYVDEFASQIPNNITSPRGATIYQEHIDANLSRLENRAHDLNDRYPDESPVESPYSPSRLEAAGYATTEAFKNACVDAALVKATAQDVGRGL